ncbi:MAG: GNAT family N-acetyltransferase [Rudaea sp.]
MAAATSAEIVIRGARDADAEALADLSTQLGYPLDAGEMRKRLARVRAARAARAGEVFVAEDVRGHVVGWTHVAPRLQLEDGAFAELAGLVVDEAARGSGVGAALLAAAEHWACAQGFASMRVRSNVIRERAHRFYEREGYARIKAQAVLRKSLTAQR